MISSRKRKWRYKAVSRPNRIKRLRKEDNDIRKFVAWCKEVGIQISKQVFERISVLQKIRIYLLFLLQVSLTRRGSCANIGMMARKQIPEGTCLAKIPRTAVLCCRNSKLHKIINRDKELFSQLPQLTSWLPLILTLLYEEDQEVSTYSYFYPVTIYFY